MKRKELLFPLLFVVIFLPIVLFFFVILPSGWQYVTAKTTMNVPAMMGQPAKELKTTSWLSPKGMRMDYGEGWHMLFIHGEGNFYILYPDKKEYSAIVFEEVKPMVEMINNMYGEVTASSKDTGKHEKVGDWDAKIWEFNMKSKMGETKVTSWDSTRYTETPVVKKYFEEAFKFQGKRGDFYKEIMKSDGMPLKMIIEMTMFNQKYKITSITTEISEEEIPDTMFEVPKDYKKVPVNPQIFMMGFM